MDLVRLMVLSTVMIGLFLLHAQLVAFKEGVNVYARAQGNWGVECFYYTPFEIFTLDLESGLTCPGRVRVPGRGT